MFDALVLRLGNGNEKWKVIKRRKRTCRWSLAAMALAPEPLEPFSASAILHARNTHLPRHPTRVKYGFPPILHGRNADILALGVAASL